MDQSHSPVPSSIPDFMSDIKPGLQLIQAKTLFCLKHCTSSGTNHFCLNYGDKGPLGPFPFASIVFACDRSKYQVMGKT